MGPLPIVLLPSSHQSARQPAPLIPNSQSVNALTGVSRIPTRFAKAITPSRTAVEAGTTGSACYMSPFQHLFGSPGRLEAIRHHRRSARSGCFTSKSERQSLGIGKQCIISVSLWETARQLGKIFTRRVHCCSLETISIISVQICLN